MVCLNKFKDEETVPSWSLYLTGTDYIMPKFYATVITVMCIYT